MSQRNNKDSVLVYSTDQGRICPGCGKASAKCMCRQKKTIPRGDGIVRISRETKGRKGKGVTVITGIPLDHQALQKLVKSLKRRCGAGGTLKEGTIEIQGDHRDLLVEELEKKGYSVKRSGG